mgnify:CR=1 FL=1
MNVTRSRKNKKQGLQEVFPRSNPLHYNIATPLENDRKMRSRNLWSSSNNGERKRSKIITEGGNRKGWTDVYQVTCLNEEITLADINRVSQVDAQWGFDLHAILEPNIASPYNRKVRRKKLITLTKFAITLRP